MTPVYLHTPIASLQAPITVQIGSTTAKRNRPKCSLARRPNPSHLLPVPKNPPVPVEKDTPLIVKLALLNIRSLIKKYFLINDLISTYNLDFLLLTET